MKWTVLNSACLSPVCSTGISVSLYFFSLLNSQNPTNLQFRKCVKNKETKTSIAKTAFYFEFLFLILKIFFWWHTASESAPLHLQTIEKPCQVVSLVPTFKSHGKPYSLFLFLMKGLTAHCCNKIMCYEGSIHKINLLHIKYWFSNFIINENYNAYIHTQSAAFVMCYLILFFVTLQFTRVSLVQIMRSKCRVIF